MLFNITHSMPIFGAVINTSFSALDYDTASWTRYSVKSFNELLVTLILKIKHKV